MKKNAVKAFCLLVISTLLTTNLAACGTKKAETGNDTGSSDVKPLETIKYRIMRNNAGTGYPAEGGEGRQAILEKLKQAGINGVDFELIFGGSGSDYDTKLNLMISSNETPDMFRVTSVQNAIRFIEEGITLEVGEYVKNMPNYSKSLRKSDADALKYDGKQYILTSGYRPEPFNTPNTDGFVIRKDWLDNLGLKMPETLEDMYKVLKAFTMNDPDKNGKNDTVGLGGSKGTKYNGIFGAFGVAPDFWHLSNGRLKQGRVLPETKEALKYLQNWYKEGLIDKDFPVIDSKQMNEKIINSIIGIYPGTGFHLEPTNNIDNSLKKITPTAMRAIMPAPKGPKGLSGWPEQAPGYEDRQLVSKNIKDPARFFKLIDWAFTDDGALLLQQGIEGKDFEYNRQANTIKQLYANANEINDRGFGNQVRFIQLVDRRWMSKEGLEALSNCGKNVIKNEFWQTVPAIFDYPDIDKIWDEYYTKIVTGALPVDAWDEFVQRYYQAGGKTIEDQVNEAWKKNK